MRIALKEFKLEFQQRTKLFDVHFVVPPTRARNSDAIAGSAGWQFVFVPVISFNHFTGEMYDRFARSYFPNAPAVRKVVAAKSTKAIEFLKQHFLGKLIKVLFGWHAG